MYEESVRGVALLVKEEEEEEEEKEKEEEEERASVVVAEPSLSLSLSLFLSRCDGCLARLRALSLEGREATGGTEGNKGKWWGQGNW